MSLSIGMTENEGGENMGEVGFAQLPKFLCLRCDHAWTARINQKPGVCPKCKSPYWDKIRQKDQLSGEHEK